MLAILFLLQASLEPQTSGTSRRLQAVSPVSEFVVWVSGTGGIWAVTTNGGATWRTGVVPGADSLEFRDVQAFDARSALLLAVAGVLPILRTADGGRQWALIATAPAAVKGEGAFAASGTCVATLGDSTGWIATGAGESARILTATDRGATWRAVVTPIVQGTPSSGHASVAFRTPRDGLAAGGDIADTSSMAAHRVVVTGDGGATWQVGGAVTFAGPIYGAAFVPGGGARAVAVGPRGASWSSDGGRSWMPLDSLSHWIVAFASPAAGWMVGPGGRITKTRLP